MRQFQLLKARRFGPLFLTQFLGAFNDNFLKNAIVILITYRAVTVAGVPPAQMVAAAGGIFILPFFLFSATAGQLADKMEKSLLIRWVKIIEIGIMLMAGIGFVLEIYELLLVALFFMGLHSTFFGPIKYSILPQHLATDELVGGNALIESGTFLAILMGTIAGGVLILEPSGAWIVSIALTVVAAAGLWTSLPIPQAPAVDPGLTVQWNPIPPTIEIIALTRKTRSVFLSILGISWFWFFGGAMLSLFPPFCKDVLGSEPSLVTLFLSIFSVGIGLGSLLCERLSRRQLELGLVPLGSIGISVFTADLFFAGIPSSSQGMGVLDFLRDPAGIRIVADLLLLSIFSGFFIVPLYTLMQERSEMSHRSRIIAGNNILNALFMVVSSVMLMGLMHFGFTVAQIFLILAVLNGVVAVYIYTLLPEFLIRFMIWILANLVYRLRVQGAEKVPTEGAAVLVCNHVSFVDWMVIAAGVKRPVRFIMDHTYAKGWPTRTLCKQAKVILIAPASENAAILRASFETVACSLREGELVCIFPEGRLTADGNLNPFKSGVEKIIRDTPVPVIPMALRGLWGSLFSRKGGRAILKWPTRFWSRVELVIASPVAPESASAAKLQEKVAELLR